MPCIVAVGWIRAKHVADLSTGTAVQFKVRLLNVWWDVNGTARPSQRFEPTNVDDVISRSLNDHRFGLTHFPTIAVDIHW